MILITTKILKILFGAESEENHSDQIRTKLKNRELSLVCRDSILLSQNDSL